MQNVQNMTKQDILLKKWQDDNENNRNLSTIRPKLGVTRRL